MKKSSITPSSNIQSSFLEQFLNGTPKQSSNVSSTKSTHQFIPKSDSLAIPQT